MRAWIEPPEIEIPEELLQLVGGQPLVARALIRRGYADLDSARAFLDPACYTPAAPEALPDLEQAVARLQIALRQAEHILVWGDFDVDGQTATTVLVASLRQLGGRVSFHIPVRAQESHGVGLPVLRRLLDAPDAPTVLLTCDTGIAAYEAAAFAKERQVDLIITDHHELPAGGLPAAIAVVTPRRLPAGHRLSSLPGVGVAYKLAEALFRAAGDPSAVEQHLDLAALGIVADVAQLTGEARYLLQRGLERLRQPQRAGLLALYERAGVEAARITEEQLGFILAPRLNALGRLADANVAVELLSTADLGRARLLALELEGLNSRRQLLTSQVLQAALRQIEQEPTLREGEALVLAHPDWAAGVIGIVASRLVELFGKPAALIAAPPGQAARGSARSVEGVDITAAIATQAEWLSGFGGHRMAAGFALPAENIAVFRRGLSQAVAAQRAALPPEQVAAQNALLIDGQVAWSELNLELAEALERLAPFGAGNPPLALVCRELRRKSQAAFGRQDEHLGLTLEDANGQARRVVWWGAGDLQAGEMLPHGLLDVAFTLRATAFRGQRELQLTWLDAHPSLAAADLQATPAPLLCEDYRREAHPWPVLQRILAEARGGQIQVWVEAADAARLAPLAGEAGRDRLRLSACETLVIWSTPPSPSELATALAHTQARRVVVFAIDPQLDQPAAFLERLGGLLKYAIARQDGWLEIAWLAAATAQREWAARLGLEWWAAKGQVRLLPEEEAGEKPARLRLAMGGQADPPRLAVLADQIEFILDETRAYRAYFTRQTPLVVGA